MNFLKWLASDGGEKKLGVTQTLHKDTEPTDDETIRLLRRIEENTSATHFWTRVTGIPVLIGMIVGFLMAMVECSK